MNTSSLKCSNCYKSDEINTFTAIITLLSTTCTLLMLLIGRIVAIKKTKKERKMVEVGTCRFPVGKCSFCGWPMRRSTSDTSVSTVASATSADYVEEKPLLSSDYSARNVTYLKVVRGLIGCNKK